MTFEALSPLWKGIIMTWLLSLMMVWSFIIIRTLHQKRTAPVVAINVFLGLGTYFVLQMLDYDEELLFGLRLNSLLYDADIRSVIAAVLLLTGLSVASLIENCRWSENNIKPMSVKEGADSVPSGLCVYMENGMTLLVNMKMHELSRRLFGRDLTNGNQFWQQLKEGRVQENVMLRQFMSLRTATLPDGTVWMLTRKNLRLEDYDAYQLTAVDVTEDYGYLRRVREDTFRLRKMNHRLRLYGSRVEEVIRTEENLAARVRIHNDMGRVLLAVKAFIQNAPGIDARELLELWKMNLSLMHGNAGTKDGEYDPMESLTQAAQFLGVTVELHGTLPRTEKIKNLFFAAAREALTNAVRHGRAKTLTICTEREEGCFRAVFTNDGISPDGEMTEGSGLGNLRRMVENAGCRMRIETAPHFALIIEKIGETEE